MINIATELLNDYDTFANAVGQAKWVALRYRVARTTGDGVLLVVGFVRDPEWSGEITLCTCASDEEGPRAQLDRGGYP